MASGKRKVKTRRVRDGERIFKDIRAQVGEQFDHYVLITCRHNKDDSSDLQWSFSHDGFALRALNHLRENVLRG